VRIEHLLQERGAGAGMAESKASASGWSISLQSNQRRRTSAEISRTGVFQSEHELIVAKR